jgi:hypothetical protein
MAKYHAIKSRQEAEQAYWESDDPHFLANIPPSIIRSYEPGTAMAFPALPDLAKSAGGDVQVEDMYDARDEVKATELAKLPHVDLGIKGPRKGQHKITRTENIVENALRRDGTVLKHNSLVRAYNQWACIAVKSTPLAVEFVEARGRGKVSANVEGESITAMHVSVQRAAFTAHPIALMMFPQKFDDQLTRKEYAPRVFQYARELALLYGKWVQLGKSFDLPHHQAINASLRDCATNAKCSLYPPLLDLMKLDKDVEKFALVAEGSYRDMVEAANWVINQIGSVAGPSESFSVDEMDLASDQVR